MRFGLKRVLSLCELLCKSNSNKEDLCHYVRPVSTLHARYCITLASSFAKHFREGQSTHSQDSSHTEDTLSLLCVLTPVNARATHHTYRCIDTASATSTHRHSHQALKRSFSQQVPTRTICDPSQSVRNETSVKWSVTTDRMTIGRDGTDDHAAHDNRTCEVRSIDPCSDAILSALSTAKVQTHSPAGRALHVLM
jgi:hypothetical protein